MQSSTENKAYLQLIFGCMFARKTRRLVEIYKECMKTGIEVLVINHITDNRYSNNELSTHDHIRIPCINLDNLNDIFNDEENFKKLKMAKIILINEGQFFLDLYDFTLNQLETYNKQIYICGLDGDFQRKKFGYMLDLIPLADSIIKLTANCVTCNFNKAAIFTHRIIKNNSQTLVGGAEIYTPVCRECYIKLNSSENQIITEKIFIPSEMLDTYTYM